MGCAQPAVTNLRSEALCLVHFCSRCYEILDGIDKERQSDEAEHNSEAERSLFAEECARRALDISMSARSLNNLERARLLDILLWCGDLGGADETKVAAATSARARKPYEKPKLTIQKPSAALRL
jgi:hypothetical protein